MPLCTILPLARGATVALGVVALTAQCRSEPTAPPLRRLTTVNHVLENHRLYLDGDLLGYVPGGTTQVRFIPDGEATLEFRAERDDPVLASDYPGQMIKVPAGDVTVDVTNVVDGKTYFAVRFTGPTSGEAIKQYGTNVLSFAVTTDYGLHCLGSAKELPAGPLSTGYQYLEFTAIVTARMYDGGCDESKPALRTWTHDELQAAMAPESGFALLTF